MLFDIFFYSSTRVLLGQIRGPNVYARLQLRSSFHNSRRSVKRPGLNPDPLEHIQIDSGPLHAGRLVKPLLFTVGVRYIFFRYAKK